ncbi:MAG: hypothetical protein ABJH04_15935 [Cyclobacteriaceae bacterium]|jgi:hypothetical protein
MDTVKIRITKELWGKLYSELRDRGNGETESGAFLLGNESSNEIIDVLYYDDLEPGCLDSGAIHLTNRTFIRLTNYCHENSLSVKADIHTHPGRFTSQSFIDEENPMIKVKGHIGIIVPFFALPSNCDFKKLGIHEFLGNGFRWKSYKYSDRVFVVEEDYEYAR